MRHINISAPVIRGHDAQNWSCWFYSGFVSFLIVLLTFIFEPASTRTLGADVQIDLLCFMFLHFHFYEQSRAFEHTNTWLFEPNCWYRLKIDPPSLPPYAYEGCYADLALNDQGQNVRLFQGWPVVTWTTPANNTWEQCRDYCNNQPPLGADLGSPYHYFGVEGNTCRCGNGMSHPLGVDNKSLCTYKCAGNQLQACGGPNRFTLFRNTTWVDPYAQPSALPSLAATLSLSLSPPIVNIDIPLLALSAPLSTPIHISTSSIVSPISTPSPSAAIVSPLSFLCFRTYDSASAQMLETFLLVNKINVPIRGRNIVSGLGPTDCITKDGVGESAKARAMQFLVTWSGGYWSGWFSDKSFAPHLLCWHGLSKSDSAPVRGEAYEPALMVFLPFWGESPVNRAKSETHKSFLLRAISIVTPAAIPSDWFIIIIQRSTKIWNEYNDCDVSDRLDSTPCGPKRWYQKLCVTEHSADRSTRRTRIPLLLSCELLSRSRSYTVHMRSSAIILHCDHLGCCCFSVKKIPDPSSHHYIWYRSTRYDQLRGRYLLQKIHLVGSQLDYTCL